VEFQLQVHGQQCDNRRRPMRKLTKPFRFALEPAERTCEVVNTRHEAIQPLASAPKPSGKQR